MGLELKAVVGYLEEIVQLFFRESDYLRDGSQDLGGLGVEVIIKALYLPSKSMSLGQRQHGSV